MPRANRPNFVSVSKSNWRLSNCARDAIWLQRKSIEADIEYVPRPRPWTPPCWTHWLRLKTPIMAPFFAARDNQLPQRPDLSGFGPAKGCVAGFALRAEYERLTVPGKC